LNLWILGYLDQAVERSLDAIAYAEQISHPYSLVFAHGMAALLHSLRKDPQTALMHSDIAYRLAKDSGFPFFLSLSMIIRGWGRVKSGKTGMAVRLVENGIEGMRAIGVELALPYFLALLAEVYKEAGSNIEAIQLVETALSGAQKNHEQWYQSGLYCLMGDLLTDQSKPDEEIISSYLQAIEIATQQDAKTFELLSAIAMTRLEKRGEHAGEYRARLGEISRWFDEGFDDPLLLEARALAGR
jgi:adenylate cyclase